MESRFAFLAGAKLARVLRLLNGAGEETRVIGGAVRAALMGLTPADFDLATTLLPQEVMALAKAADIRAVPTGIDHGTITLVLDGTPFEVTTLREDIDTDGRHAKVRFGRNFIADALRRDFTMNALSVSPDGRLHDYVNGQADIAARHVRFIGAASQRIAEDHLRSLRFFRFHAAFGVGAPDAEAMTAIIAAREELLNLSRERVRAEMFKLLVAPGAADVAAIMSDCGIFGLLLAGLVIPARLAHLLREAGGQADAVLRLAALAVLTQEDAERLREHLRLSNEEALRLAGASRVAASLHSRFAPPDSLELQRLMLLHGGQAVRDGLWLAQIDARDANWSPVHATLAGLPQPRLPFSGADLQRHGIAAGPQMGAMLKTLQAQWIRAGFPKDPATLAALLAQVVAKG